MRTALLEGLSPLHLFIASSTSHSTYATLSGRPIKSRAGFKQYMITYCIKYIQLCLLIMHKPGDNYTNTGFPVKSTCLQNLQLPHLLWAGSTVSQPIHWTKEKNKRGGRRSTNFPGMWHCAKCCRQIRMKEKQPLPLRTSPQRCRKEYNKYK